MRTISAGLATAQAVRSPRWEVSLAASGRGQMPGAPMVAWTRLVSNVGETAWGHATAVGKSNGGVLRFRTTATNIQIMHVADPTAAADWGGTWVNLRSHSALGLAALRAPGSQTIRLFFVYTNNSIYSIHSNNDGGTWSTPVAVYTGADAIGDLVVGYVDDGSVADGPWFVGFSSYNGGTGEYTARFARQVGGTWQVASYGPGWRAAGVGLLGAVPGARHVCAVFRQDNTGPSRIRVMDNSGGTLSNVLDVDQTQSGLHGLHLYHARYCALPELNISMGMVGEGAYGAGAYAGLAGVWQQDSQWVADEPIIFDGLDSPSDKGHFAVCETTAGDLYVVGDEAVWRGEVVTVPATLPAPISYTVNTGQGEFKLPVDSGAAQLRPGMQLTVTRTARWGAASGSEALRLVIVRVEVATDGIVVLANDALAMLGTARCRRPYIGNDGSATGAAMVMRRLAARFGIPVRVDNTSLETAAVMPMTVMPSESLRGAAYRVGSQSEWYLVPDSDGFGLVMVTPGTSDSGEHDGSPVVLGEDEGVLWRAAEIREYRRLAFAYVMGSYSTDPEDGGAVGMAAGRVEPGTRPLSYSFTNLRYNTATRVRDAAIAEAARQADTAPGATVTINGHLGLEVYDVVEVTEPIIGWAARAWRVREMREEYDKGRLTMRLLLGEV